MAHRILTTRIDHEQGLVRVRDRTRQIGELCGLDKLQRTRFVTAVSEIARNCVQFAGSGAIEFWLREADSNGQHQALIVKAVDKGPGIQDIQSLLDNTGQSQGRTRLGIAGSRRLVDSFDIQSRPGEGTTVTLEMRIPPAVAPIRPEQLITLLDQMLRRREQTPNDELEQQNREMLFTLEALRERQTELQQADERKNEFLAMLAHELRNPLSAIRTALELIKRRTNATPEDVQRIGSMISRQTDQLTRLVNGLLDVARVTQGKIDLEMQPLILGDLVSHALEMTQSMIDAKGHEVEVIHSPEPIWIEADPVRFKQVLSNLFHNAARYTPSGGQIRIEVAVRDDQAVVRVEDNGVGIAPEMLPRVFDLFTQAQSGLGRQDAGLGVGLTVVQRMVTEHGGTVSVESPGIGLGSTFTASVPVSVERTPTIAEGIALPQASHPLRVLLIDDNIDAADMLRQMLIFLHYQVRMVHTGEAGVTEARQWQPDVIIVDIGLPGMSGFDVANDLRGNDSTRDMKVIALSGYSLGSFANQDAYQHFDQYLEKPVEISALATLLSAASPRSPESALHAPS